MTRIVYYILAAVYAIVWSLIGHSGDLLIPYISRLFKNVAYGREANSLMIMVTPRIIINEEEEQIFLGQLPAIPR